MHGPELSWVQLICLALLVGAAMRALSRAGGPPYTLGLLLLGVGLGLLARSVADDHSHGLLGLLSGGPLLSPGLVAFVFLPALVFESASALNVFAVRRELGAIALLAIPAMLLSAGLAGALMVWLTAGGWGWGWIPALVFGALISATDPVAVVALMREVGAPARLGVLVEGESLANDGTAIVVFGTLLGLLAGGSHGHAPPLDPGGVALNFVVVVAGGVLVGGALALLVGRWLQATFNDELLEITLTLLLAYAAMALAEGALHVSGVIAVVAAGLWLAGPGRMQVSPEVRRSMHHVWELLAYLANTLIFVLVGVLIALNLHQASWADFGVILAAYVGLTVIRFAVTYAFRPLLGLVAEPVSLAEATVMAWSGLRGAVSLGLALLVYQAEAVPAALGEQVLLVTAGVVLLTVVVNGGTAGALIRWLRLDQPRAGDRLAGARAEAGALREVEARLIALRDGVELPTVPWARRLREIGERRAAREAQVDELGRTEEADSEEASSWRRALVIERQVYWRLHAEGALTEAPLRSLDHELDLHRDRVDHGQLAPPAARPLAPPLAFAWLAPARRLLGLAGEGAQLSRMALRYDLTLAVRSAAREVLAAIDGEAQPIVDCYRGYLAQATEALEDMRANLPEVTSAVEARLGQRIELNLERAAYRRLAQSGAISSRHAEQLRLDVERRISRLGRRELELEIRPVGELLRASPLFRELDAAAIEALERVAEERVLPPGETIAREGEPGDSLLVVARGAVRVLRQTANGEQLLGVHGSGAILGEMALLTGEARNATLLAATTVTLAVLPRAAFQALSEEHPEVLRRCWMAHAEHQLDNTLRASGRDSPLAELPRARLRAWLTQSEPNSLPAGEAVEAPALGSLLLLHGQLEVSLGGDDQIGQATLSAPALLDLGRYRSIVSSEGGATVLILPAAP